MAENLDSCWCLSGTFRLLQIVFAPVSKLFAWPVAMIWTIGNETVLLGVFTSLGYRKLMLDREKYAWLDVKSINDIQSMGLNITKLHPELRGVPLVCNLGGNINKSNIVKMDGFSNMYCYFCPFLAEPGDDIVLVFINEDNTHKVYLYLLQGQLLWLRLD